MNPAVSAELEDSDDEDMTAARMDALTLEGEAGNSEEDEALLLRYEKYLDEVEKKSSGGNDDAIANEDAEQKRKLTNRRVSQWRYVGI